MTRVNSCRKGKRGELEAVHFLRSLGFGDAHRTQQHNGDGRSDVECPDSLPGLHIEVKYGYDRSFDLGTKLFREAIEQCDRDCGGAPWVLLWRPKGTRVWRFTQRRDGLIVTTTDAACIRQYQH